MAARELPPIDYLRQRLRYEPETGNLFWRAHPAMQGKWNSRHSGNEAGSVKPSGYRIVCLDNQMYRAHRLIWAMQTGAWPEADVDHEDHQRANNCWANLRVASRKGNCQNATLSRRNTSGTTGVCWDARRGLWFAQIHPDRRKIHLGYFQNKDDAIEARKAAERRLGFHANHGASNG